MKKAIVIGATSGIGRKLALLLADDGYEVIICGRRTELLEALQTERPESFICQTMDVADTVATTGLLHELATKYGHVDLLVLSSGTGDLNPELEFETEKRTINTNVSGFTAIADWVFNYFSQQESGHFAAITSVAGIRGNSMAPSYSASKAYQINYLESLRIKAFKNKLPITITDIRPGFVDTEMAKGEGLFWVASVDMAAGQILKALHEKRKIIYITRRWRFIAWTLKTLPGILLRRI